MASSRSLDEQHQADQCRAAVELWCSIGSGRHRKPPVEVLQAERARSVYRLIGAHDDGYNVIAKRAGVDTIERERLIYQEILPGLPGRHLALLGHASEIDGLHAWLFLEEATGKYYCGSNPDHRRLAGEWLATLHTSAQRLPAPHRLEKTGAARFHEDLLVSPPLLRAYAADRSLEAEQRATLERIAAQLGVVAAHWDDLVHWCQAAPQTLVHGDFKEDNIRLTRTRDGKAILAFDWHESGFGPPVLDLAKFLGYSISPSVGAYCEVARRDWPWMRVEQVYHLGYIGEVFRCIASIRWEAERLQYGWLPTVLNNLQLFHGWLCEIVRAEPWNRSPERRQAREPAARSWF